MLSWFNYNIHERTCMSLFDIIITNPKGQKKKKKKKKGKQNNNPPTGCWAALKIGLSASGSVGPNFANSFEPLTC